MDTLNFDFINGIIAGLTNGQVEAADKRLLHSARISSARKEMNLKLSAEQLLNLAEARRAAGPSSLQKATVSAVAKERHDAYRAAQEPLFLECINNPVLVNGKPSLLRSAQKYGVSTRAVKAYARRVGIL